MVKKYDKSIDKNFDDLTHHFKKNIYGRLKGKIRLAVIERDLAPYISKPLNIIDAGGGQGQFSLSLAQNGHSVIICDISKKMLALAKDEASKLGIENVKFLECPIQELQNNLDTNADLITCHAVLEWMANPEEALEHLSKCIKEDGILSLAFFNVNSLIFKNLIRGNYYKASSNDFVGMEGSLTPINPLKIKDVLKWCEETGFEILEYSGIRVFNDYIADQATRNRHPEAVVEMELKFSQEEPYRSLGRYIHVVAKKRDKKVLKK